MVVAFVRRLGEALFARCPALRRWSGCAIIALLATSLGLSLNFPDYKHQLDVLGLAPPRSHLAGIDQIRRCRSEQIANPFVRHSFSDNTLGDHTEKVAFRLSMPVLGHVLGLRLGQLVLLQQFCGVLFLGLVYKLAWRATGDSVCAALLPFGFAFSYIGQACFFDLIPWFDGMAYCGLAVAMCFRNPAVIFLGMCFACWSDERAVVVSPLLLMWWVVQDAGQAQADARQRVLRNPQVWAMVLAVLSYVAGRLALGHLWQIRQWHKDLLPLGPWANRWPFFLVGLAISLKWLWLIVCGGGLAAFLNHKRWLAATMILFVVAYLGSCALVLDTTRSAAYAFPSVILGLACLSRTQPPKRVRWLIFGICVLCALTPSPFVIRNALIFMPNVFMPMGWSPLLIQDGRVTPLPTGW